MKEKFWMALTICAGMPFALFAIIFVVGSFMVIPVETIAWLALDTAVVAAVFKAARS